MTGIVRESGLASRYKIEVLVVGCEAAHNLLSNVTPLMTQPQQRSKQPSMSDITSVPRSAAAVDARVVDAWCEWLGALATDAEAALAAALAYKQLDASARDTWLSALEQDALRLSVPRIAVYAPLLAVESDPKRRARITEAMGPLDATATPRTPAYGLSGRSRDGTRIAMIVTPLYLDFAQVLACAYRLAEGFSWVKHDPIVDRRGAPMAGTRVEDVALESAPLKPLVDELAHAVLAHKRSGRKLPEALRVFADLFTT